MSIDSVKLAIADKLKDITSPKALAKVYARAKEATDVGEMPCAIISLAGQEDHAWKMEASGLGRTDYTLTIYVLIGARASFPIGELTDRAEPWAEAIATELMADQRLGRGNLFLGSPTDNVLFTYRMGVISWNKVDYFGLRLSLPVTEKVSMETA